MFLIQTKTACKAASLLFCAPRRTMLHQAPGRPQAPWQGLGNGCEGPAFGWRPRSRRAQYMSHGKPSSLYDVRTPYYPYIIPLEGIRLHPHVSKPLNSSQTIFSAESRQGAFGCLFTWETRAVQMLGLRVDLCANRLLKYRLLDKFCKGIPQCKWGVEAQFPTSGERVPG